MLHVTLKFGQCGKLFVSRAPLIRMQSVCERSNLPTGTSDFAARIGTESASVLNRKPTCIQINCKEMHFDRIIRKACVCPLVCVSVFGVENELY